MFDQCIDRDECSDYRYVDQCNNEGQTCQNTIGSYMCVCRSVLVQVLKLQMSDVVVVLLYQHISIILGLGVCTACRLGGCNGYYLTSGMRTTSTHQPTEFPDDSVSEQGK